MNILISALGSSPDIIEETISLFNYSSDNDMYRSLSGIDVMRKKIETVSEVWLLATDQPSAISPKGSPINSTGENYNYIKEQCQNLNVRFRLFILKETPDITSADDAIAFRDMTLRVVSFAKHKIGNNGHLYLSLACGRKTMSADIQDAAYCFGCDELVHVLGNNKNDAHPILLGKVSANEALKIEPFIFDQTEILRVDKSSDYFNQVERQKQEASHFFTSYYLNEKETRSNFHILYTLSPSKIKQLKEEIIGVDKSRQDTELNWLKQLPKTDLHCHLGGVLFPEEIMAVAEKNELFDKQTAKNNSSYNKWLNEELPRLDADMADLKNYCQELSNRLHVPKSCIISPYLRKMSKNGNSLQTYIYNRYRDEADFCGIGIDSYEKLGDIQGSSLLDCLNSITTTLDLFFRRCIENNVKYVEIRCSPLNYSKTSDIPAEQIVLHICNRMQSVESQIKTSLIFIVSRHRNDTTGEYVNLVGDLKGKNLFDKYFRGFDLAGNESARSPQELRESFIEIMKDCYNITIHAGETEPVDSIWQAVYHLNAERIGHGLTLEDNEDLLKKFLQRGIGIEMCPSSNYQIVGFRDNYFPNETAQRKVYPLKQYLENDLPVSINTDDPGISLTDMTHELHKAARMTEGGLSKWQILQLICNGFRTAFFPYDRKKELIRTAENCLGDLIKNDLL